MSDIIYTHVDEAPALASGSWLPIITAFAKTAGIDIVPFDISLAGRILAQFPDHLTPAQTQNDDLAILGKRVLQADTNVIKLPNISASLPQLKAAIAELQAQGYAVPNYPEHASTDDERRIQNIYDSIKGSAVNPVLRQGNSDRRAATAVKNYAKKHPHRMSAWSPQSRTRVTHMPQNDFYGNETSLTIDTKHAGNARIEWIGQSGKTQILKDSIQLNMGDILDSTHLSVQTLHHFIEQAMAEAKKNDLLLSLHLKATMMKISDPILFGEVVKTYFADVFTKHADTFATIGINPNNGLGDIYHKINSLDANTQQDIKDDIQACIDRGPALAMVDSDKGITNLHVPSDVIIDASMPAAIRGGGKMWNADGNEQDTLAMIPDRSYAGIYQATIDFCRENGAFDPRTMGSVANVGLMAEKAEEYGSHDKTFQAPDDGVIQIVAENGDILLSQSVQKNDIFRACLVKDIPIQNWIALAIKRAQLTDTPVIFWLDEKRAHDAELIKKVQHHLNENPMPDLNIKIMAPNDAMQFSLRHIKQGKDCIAATGNVLRDYLTDLFPILELGTSAKMLSIVPLINGGGLFETGAGGSAPKHVQQVIKEGHLRWDSLGEFLALAESLKHLAQTQDKPAANVLAKALDAATEELLENDRSPKRKVGTLSNNASHAYEAMYWAQQLAAQNDNPTLKKIFTPVAKALTDNINTILKELNDATGHAVDLGGYYHPDPKKVDAAMRPSNTLNAIMEQLMQNTTPPAS